MSFTVTLKPSNQQFTVNPDETVLDAASRQQVVLPFGCRNGRCGACVGDLLEGQVTYPEGQPATLAHADANKLAPCKACATTDLTIGMKTLDSANISEPKMLPCRVHKIDHLAHDVVRLWLKLPDNQRLSFQAGQYLNFILADGRRRAFSIANAPHDDEYIELHIRHVDGGEFTDWVFNQMKDRSILRIEAPLGTFLLNENADRPLLFIGGGTGFAPLKGQLEHAFHQGMDRPMKLYWGVRAHHDLYLPQLPGQWAENHSNFAFIPVFSEPDADWRGRTGFVHQAVLHDIKDLSEYDIYMAGPPVMVKAACDAFQRHNVPSEQMHYDAFEYAEK
jgi:CDP-4-dehydro-6-deoxyglucose reductase